MSDDEKLKARVTVMLQDHKPDDIINEIRIQTASTSHDRIRELKHVDRVVE